MSEIRNGGFELGNVDFWTVETTGSLIIDSGNQKYGTYSGKYTSGGTNYELIVNNDYIPVRPYDLVSLVAWVKSNTTRRVMTAVYIYDSDYSYIGCLYGGRYTMDNTYLEVASQILLPADAAYIRAGIRIQSSAVDEVFYFDGYNAEIVDGRYGVAGTIRLANFIDVNATGNTSTLPKDLMQFREYYADLYVTSGSGTNQTLDITVYDKGMGANTVLVGTFAQKTALSSERIKLSDTIGRNLSILYTIGGTNPLFSFTVDIVGKR